MFRKEINFISDLNLNKLQDLGDRFTIHDIKKIKIHPALIQFIESEIDLEILKDRKKIEDDSVFDYMSDRINNYFALISDEIKRTQLFSQSYIRQLIQKGIIFNINYLIKPNKALTKLIFEESDIKSVEEIVIGLSHAYYYQYLKKIVLTYLEKKKVIIMRREEFFSLLQNIDSISRQTHLDDTITTAVNSIANFFDQDKKNPETVPVEGLKMYLRERELNEFFNYVDDTYDNETNSYISAPRIISELQSVTPVTEIEIEESKKIEDEFVPDSSEDISAENDLKSQSSDQINSEIGQGVILEVQEDEVEIPNNQILSDENISENDINEKEEPQSEEDIKKKPDSIALLKKLFNINTIYDSLLSKPKPFEDFINYKEMFERDDHLKNETDYKLDHFTLSETIEVTETEESEVNIEADIFDENTRIDQEELIEENVSTDSEKDSGIVGDSDIETRIDEIVEDADIEEEYIAENKTMEIVDQDLINEEELHDSNPVNDDIKLDVDDELTEVFTDLTFLDNVEDDLEVETEENREDEIQENETSQEHYEELEQNEENISSSFKEVIQHKDMTKIIEFIFDYDMEDYHLALNKISDANNEEEAFNFIENYCKNNHIEINSNEVHQFKSLISEYYTQAYS